ncbi:hypothetical protein M0R72_11975 [Candidatus Pacearchaeota archaeon]|nr:hypothetical protein [Candidatus Pacearchaeota archaeon]
MFGRSEIGGSGWKLGRFNQFCHKSHYPGAHEQIAYGVALNKYMRETGCDRQQARANVEVN